MSQARERDWEPDSVPQREQVQAEHRGRDSAKDSVRVRARGREPVQVPGPEQVLVQRVGSVQVPEATIRRTVRSSTQAEEQRSYIPDRRSRLLLHTHRPACTARSDMSRHLIPLARRRGASRATFLEA
jgi:hypothetical protein